MIGMIKKAIIGTILSAVALGSMVVPAFANTTQPQACIGQGISGYTRVAKDNSLGKFVVNFVQTLGGQNLNDAARAELCP